MQHLYKRTDKLIGVLEQYGKHDSFLIICRVINVIENVKSITNLTKAFHFQISTAQDQILKLSQLMQTQHPDALSLIREFHSFKLVIQHLLEWHSFYSAITL